MEPEPSPFQTDVSCSDPRNLKSSDAVSDACLRATGMRPSQLNQGKLPQQAADGQARPTNFFTEAQAREWADPAIHAFFATYSSARPSH